MSQSTVLLVDDDAQFRQLVAGALAARGHKVIEAATGRDGVQAMAKHKPACVIIDGLLPDGDGMKWIPKLREETPDIPIVFVSSFYRDMLSFKRLNEELRVTLVAHKPIEPTTFVAQIDALLGTTTIADMNAEVMAEIEAYRVEYKSQLPKQVNEMRASLERAFAKPADDDLWQAAREGAHKMRGTAGSYGLMPVSDAAGAIEDALLALKGVSAEVAKPHWVTIERALKQLPQQQIAPPPLPSPTTMPSDVVVVLTADSTATRALVTQGRAHGYAVVQVAELKDLVERAKARVPAAVLVDMNGRKPEMLARIAAALRTVQGADTTAIAVIDDPTEPVSESLALHAGASLRLPSGSAPDVIASAIGRMLKSRPQQTRVLVVDDDLMFGKLVLDVLGPRGIAARYIDDPTKLFDALEELNPDLILLDMNMPQMSGLELCKKIRASGKWRHVSVLFLTAQSTVEQRIAAFRAGADDYLVKPVVNEELLARVEVRVERAKLLRDRADRDALTGLPLRRAFLEQLEMRLSESKRHSRQVSVCLIDLDHFKKINDGYGHLVGDRVLAAMGNLLSTRLRTEDIRGRWGGEELVLAPSNTPAPMARQVLQRLLDELVTIPFQAEDGRKFEVSFSAGVASFPEDGATSEALLKAADTRLYSAKQAGRRRVA